MASNLCSYTADDLLPVALADGEPTEMREHVSGCDECRKRVATLGRERSTLRSAMRELAPELERVPSTIGKYFIVGRLGEGSQAIAYRAAHPELGIELVVKHAKMSSGGGAGETRDALLNEGRALARLDQRQSVSTISGPSPCRCIEAPRPRFTGGRGSGGNLVRI